MPEPEISVIVASFNSSATISATLDSLYRQEGDVPYEVIVVDSSRDGAGELVARCYPQVRLFCFTERRYPGDARNYGATRAQGGILAFTDADCTIDSNFISEIYEAHKAESPVIGGVIANGNPESYIGWAHYFAEFSQWMPQREACVMGEIPTCCLSMKRWAFEKYGPFLEGIYCSDTAFHWRIREGGHTPWLRPTLCVAHTNINSFGRLMHKQIFHGRSFACLRMNYQTFTRAHRVVYILFAPLLPIVLFMRTLGRVLRKGVYRKQFAYTFPLVFLSLTAWSWGELKGYLSGPTF